MYNRILIPTDGSELATTGLEYGLALARAVNAAVTVVTVVVPPTGFVFEGIIQAEGLGEYNALVSKEVTALEHDVRERAAKAGVAVEFVTENNMSAAAAIVATAEAKGCDLIVISSHGRRGISRLMLGSQTAEVLAESKIPVLVVK